jgi:DNA-binding NtrC family response regulator
MIAQLIHNESRRNHGPFVRVNCAALSESLLESELFGHEKGAFTGAIMRRQGRLERAHGGTLLLDEITETPPAFQAKLLRALEQMHFERVGGSEDVRINVRVVSTTNQDIHRLVQEGRFRADLYYRLSAVRLRMPSLRERMDDLPDLIWWFVNEFAHEAGRVITDISTDTLRLFECSHWPGNIRQLRNVIRTAMILGQGPVLCVKQLPWVLEELLSDREGLASGDDADLGSTSLQELERRAILATLDQTEGNRTRAAEVLGISDRTLREKIKKYRRREYVTLNS